MLLKIANDEKPTVRWAFLRRLCHLSGREVKNDHAASLALHKKMIDLLYYRHS